MLIFTTVARIVATVDKLYNEKDQENHQSFLRFLRFLTQFFMGESFLNCFVLFARKKTRAKRNRDPVSKYQKTSKKTELCI